MKKIILMIALLLTMTGVQAKPIVEHLDQIVAIVNDDVVTQSELNHMQTLMREQFAQVHKSLPPSKVLREQALNELINKKLQLQIAKQVGLMVTNTDLDHVVQNIANNNNMSVADLYHRLQQEGMSTEDYRNEMREQMTVQRLQQQEAGGGQISVTADEIDHFLHVQPAQQPVNLENQEFHLQDILIPLADAPSAEEVKAATTRAHSIITQLHQGKEVQEIIQASAGEGALTENDLGWRKLAEIPTAFSQNVAKMKTDEITGPVRTANGLHIIQLVGRRAAGSTATAEETPNRAQVHQLLMQRKFAEHVQTWLSRMRSQAFISLK